VQTPPVICDQFRGVGGNACCSAYTSSVARGFRPPAWDSPRRPVRNFLRQVHGFFLRALSAFFIVLRAVHLTRAPVATRIKKRFRRLEIADASRAYFSDSSDSFSGQRRFRPSMSRQSLLSIMLYAARSASFGVGIIFFVTASMFWASIGTRRSDSFRAMKAAGLMSAFPVASGCRLRATIPHPQAASWGQ